MDSVNNRIHAFRPWAKIIVLTPLEAEQTALNHETQLEALTGAHGGMIGTLAAVGSHQEGGDGRFIWLVRLRELNGIHPAQNRRA